MSEKAEVAVGHEPVQRIRGQWRTCHDRGAQQNAVMPPHSSASFLSNLRLGHINLTPCAWDGKRRPDLSVLGRVPHA